MGVVSMNQKTRGYGLLGVCEAFFFLNAIICIFVGVLATLAMLGGETSQQIPNFLGAAFFFGWALASFAIGGLIRLAVHVADDLYMLRLIAVNAYSRLPQLPKP